MLLSATCSRPPRQSVLLFSRPGPALSADSAVSAARTPRFVVLPQPVGCLGRHYRLYRPRLRPASAPLPLGVPTLGPRPRWKRSATWPRPSPLGRHRRYGV